MVYLKEDYTNIWEEPQNEPEDVPEVELPEEEPATFALKRSMPVVQIVGPAEVYPYDTASYTINGAAGGKWLLSN